MKLRYLKLIIAGASLLAIFSLSRSVYAIWRKRDIVKARESALRQAEAENRRLKDKLAQVQSPFYVEKIARDKLGLAKPGEVIVLLPTKTDVQQEQIMPRAEVPPWKQWWQLVF